MVKKPALFIFFFLTLGFFYPKLSLAQPFNFSGNESYEVTIIDTEVKDGSLVSLSDRGYFLSKSIYDPTFVGVVNLTPDVLFGTSGVKAENVYPLSVTGKVNALVENTNGSLKIGDNITTSKTSGVGQKATEDGFVIGRSLEEINFTNNDPVPVLVQLDPHIHSKVLIFDSGVGSSGLKKIMAVFYNSLRTGGASAQDEPSKVFRYILAIIVVVITLVFGFLLFGRLAMHGLEAMGRNPLASKMITTGILINSVLTIVVALCGLILAYIIITY